MKNFIIVVHILLGMLLIYGASYNTLRHYSLVNSNSLESPQEAKLVKESLPQSIFLGILGIVLGISSAVGGILFKKEKRWTAVLLLTITVFMLLGVFYTGAILFTFLLLPLSLAVFLVIEIWYIARNWKQFS